MNGRELAFCAHYAVHRNAEKAAESAGFRSPRSNAYKILRRPHVQEQLNFLATQTMERVVLDATVVVNELGAVALTRADEFLKLQDGRWIGKRPEELNERQRACVREIKRRDVYVDTPVMNGAEILRVENVFSHQEFQYIMHDKMSALYKLGDHFGVGGQTGDNDRNPFESMSQADLEKVTEAMQGAMKLVEGDVVSG